MAEDLDAADMPAEDATPPEPKSARPYLAMLEEAEKAFHSYQQKADNIDKLYANLEKQVNATRDREFAMFWANVQVLAPSIYSRPPVPVVVPRFKDRNPVPRAASELLERATVVAFEMEDIDQVMRLVRDDLAINARGVPWVRFEKKSKDEPERICVEHVDRKDFRHDPARNWKECGWVAKRAWLTKKEMRKRFSKPSGIVYQEAEYTVQKEDRDNGAADNKSKAGVWELWHKGENKVVWIAPGCDKVLDEGAPHLTLEGFFPCPRPAYGTLQRRSLIPVPDFAFYKDQLEEINELTARISALTEAVKVRGFYPAGAGEIGDAIETALKSITNNQIMVPISNWAMFGNGGAKDAIVWLPIDMIVETITALVELRRQIIEDVYQITGLSDIMRGATDPKETLGAQQLKSQYGSVRVRDRQSELVRVARDIVRIVAEIMAENFSPKTLFEMAQMQLPSDAEIKRQERQIIASAEQQVKQAMSDPQMRAQAQQNPQMAEQMLDQMEAKVQAQIDKLRQQATSDQVMALLREQRIRPYVLDIETDSTIIPDEQAEKQARTEFLTALGGTLQQIAPLVQMMPEAAPFAAETISFAISPFRAGRSMDQAIDQLIDALKAKAGQPQPNPEADQAKADAALKEKELQGKFEIERMKLEGANAGKQQEMQARMAEIEAEAQRDRQKHEQEMQKGGLELEKLRLQIEALREKVQADAAKAQIDAASMERKAQIEEQSARQQADIAASSAQQQADIRAQQADQQAQHQDRAFEQKSALAAQQAAREPAE